MEDRKQKNTARAKSWAQELCQISITDKHGWKFVMLMHKSQSWKEECRSAVGSGQVNYVQSGKSLT